MNEILNQIDVHILSILILTTIVVATLVRSETSSRQHMVFIVMVIAVIISILTEMFTYIATPDEYYLSYYGNALSYIFTPATVYLWLLYVYVIAAKTNKKHFIVFAAVTSFPIMINTVMVFLNPLTNLYFTIDNNMVFARGPFYYFLIIISAFYLIISFITIYKHKNSSNVFYLRNLIAFTILPILGAIFQTIFFGTNMLWACFTVGILIIYQNIQNDVLNMDYLTKSFNRRTFEQHLVNKIESRSNKNFSAYMIDIDDFKSINDTYGHMTGDKAIIETVALLKKIFRKKSYVYRYGGDEFAVLCDGVIEIEEVLEKINAEIELFNSGDSLFKLNFSIGGATYDKSSNMTADDYYKLLDYRMYKNKQEKKFKRRESDK